MRRALELSARDDDWMYLTNHIDIAIDVLVDLGEERAAAVLTGAIETTFAATRFPSIANEGPSLAVRTANVARARAILGDAAYEEAYAKGAKMSKEQALSFVMDLL